ncbi:hypothetical protein ACWCP6_10090 [Streptomyces sp. NPDC002004]
MSLRKRGAGILGAAALVAGTFVGLGAAPASAADISFAFTPYADGGGRIYAKAGGNYLGDVTWQADPSTTENGDTLCAFDAWPDGRYVGGYISIPRGVNTQGLNSPNGRCKGGDIREGVKYKVQMCLYGIVPAQCSRSYEVTS